LFLIIQCLIRAIGRPFRQDEENGLIFLHPITFSLMSNSNEWSLLMMKQKFMQQSQASKKYQKLLCVIYWGKTKNVGATNLLVNITNRLGSSIWLLCIKIFFIQYYQELRNVDFEDFCILQLIIGYILWFCQGVSKIGILMQLDVMLINTILMLIILLLMSLRLPKLWK
jgi:hypothetical protein